MTTRRYGHIPDIHDPRDHKIKFTDEHVQSFSLRLNASVNNTVFDLRNLVHLPQALSNIDQGSLGSCTANAIAYAYAFDEIKQQNKQSFLPSRLFIYYNERVIENTVNRDSGAQLRDGIKSINKYGVCEEHHWIYDPLKFAVKPPKSVYDEAINAKAVKYSSIDFSLDRTIADRVAHLKRALQSGFPFVFGFYVYESFETDVVARTGIVPIPDYDNEQLLGGHAVCAVGFSDLKQSFIVKNSWGPNWGLNGYFYMPYNYLADPEQALDFWIIEQVTTQTNIPGYKSSDINPEAVHLHSKPSGGGVVNN